MIQENYRTIASQLRKPTGDLGKQVGEMMNKGNRLMNLATVKQLEPEPYDKILEIGMGNGCFVKNILGNHKTIRYTGCDFSETMIKEARLWNEDFVQSGQAQFTEASTDMLPYGNEAFNKIFTVNTIYFWDNTTAVLTEIRRVLKQNGLLIISLRPKSIMNVLPVTQYGFKTFSKQDCIELLTKNGFHKVEVIEETDHVIKMFGEEYKNAFMIVKAIKNHL